MTWRKVRPYEASPIRGQVPPHRGRRVRRNWVADIKEHGLREPVLLSSDGRVLIDGRNRYRACEAAGSTPRFKRLESHYDETRILDLIVSLNVERRHLDAGARAFLALDYEGSICRRGLGSEAEAERKANSGGPVGELSRETDITVRRLWPIGQSRRRPNHVHDLSPTGHEKMRRQGDWRVGPQRPAAPRPSNVTLLTLPTRCVPGR